jgi:hypothetical protein
MGSTTHAPSHAIAHAPPAAQSNICFDPAGKKVMRARNTARWKGSLHQLPPE